MTAAVRDLTCNNTSAGVILRSEDGEMIFLQKRKKFPWGWACPAGHVDDGEFYIVAASRELKEETGLDAYDLRLALEKDCDNQCRRQNGTWHHWCVYWAKARGNPVVNEEEVEEAGWKSVTIVHQLAQRTQEYLDGRISEEDWQANPGLEPIWCTFFKDLHLL